MGRRRERGQKAETRVPWITETANGKKTKSAVSYQVSWLLNFFVMTFPSSSPRRSATFWDRSWWELPLKSTMLGMTVARCRSGRVRGVHTEQSEEMEVDRLKTAALHGRGTQREGPKQRGNDEGARPSFPARQKIEKGTENFPFCPPASALPDL